MPINVPDEPKVYTTVYDNFKGVDITNDASNVWKHRSPDGKNMLPNLDGKPYKRCGWDIELTAQDFRDAAGIVGDVEVIPDKTYYFELGGYDHLMIFNNLGVFVYKVNPLDAQRAIFSKLLVFMDEYVPLDQSLVVNGQLPAFPPLIDGQAVPIDSGRAFFFEGQGTAGFYLFVGLKLFRYDGAYFNEVDPHVPKVLVGCLPSGAGTPIEAINMLTDRRLVQYTCDGEATVFTVPSGINTQKPFKVETRNDSGKWVERTYGTDFTYGDGKLNFGTAPKQVATGEDNLKVTYSPDGYGSSAEERNVDVNEKTVWVKRTRVEKQTKVDKGAEGAWGTISTNYDFGGVTFDIPNVKINELTKSKEVTFQNRNGSNTDWENMASGRYTVDNGAYNDKVTLKPTTALYTSGVPTSSTSWTTGAASAWWVESTYKTTTTKKVTIKDRNGKKKTTTKKVTTTHCVYARTRTVVDYKYYRVKANYTLYVYTQNQQLNEGKTAFTQCTRALVFGSGVVNQVFMSSTPYPAYNTRVWYSAATDPTYFPDTNYIEVGATDVPIMGMMKVGEYLGVIKKGVSFDTSIYLAYPTSFESTTTYAVKQNINGIGAISNGAFNVLNEEPLFLSAEGVMGIEVSTDDTDRRLRNRSYYVNKGICAEENLSQAVSFVYKGLYYLAVNGRCYVLDGSQKSSWANTKTNLQYECYYLENVPAQCFSRFQDDLMFTDFKGNLCRFKKEGDENVYRDAYSIYTPEWEANSAPTVVDGEKRFWTGNLVSTSQAENPKVNDCVRYQDDWYTITALAPDTAIVTEGVPIDAVWSTIADDDDSPQMFKNLKKKGTLISLLPSSDSGVSVYIKQDNKDRVFVGETDAKDYELPFDFYSKKKIKKYKRLQFICENNVLDDSFGVDQIIKSYTVGNYSKNRG